MGPASGTHSGTVTAASEAWCQTTQTYRSDYVRVPYFTQQAALDVFGLTQFSAIDNVSQTHLCNVVTIYNKREKVYLPVGTPGYTQYQKLALNAISTDQYAQSYGVVSGLIMGPQGSVITTQPYFDQQIWDDTKHTEYELAQVGSTYGAVSACDYWDALGTVWMNGTDNGEPLSSYIIDRNFWMEAEDWDRPYKKLQTFGVGGNLYTMYGAYNTSAEDAWNDLPNGKQRLMDYIADCVTGFTSSGVWSRLVVPQPLVSNGYSTIQDGDKVTQNTYYDIKRHDYT
jgi:hypothetical protein